MDARAAKAIDELRVLAADSSMRFDVLIKKAHALMPFAPLSACLICESGQEIYRGTNYHTSVPLRQNDISYPPAERVQSFGRASSPGKPVFYGSPDPNSVFRELRSQVGQYAVLAKWGNNTSGVPARNRVLIDCLQASRGWSGSS